jgi:hypothetical protein
MTTETTKPNPNFNLGLWRIMRECRRVTKQYDFDGDAMKDSCKAGSFEQEQMIVFLIGEVDSRILRLDRTFTRRIIRNIVLNSGVMA